MLFKLSFNNMRRSLRDYAIYFFTLIIGVSIFYVFNATSGQAAMMKVSASTREIIELLKESNRVNKQTLILITHDEGLAMQADRVISIEDGRIIKNEQVRNIV